MNGIADGAAAGLDERLGATPRSAAAVRDGRLLGRWDRGEYPLFPIYSLSKTYIATLVLLAVRSGRLDLDAPLADRCPDLPGADTISLRRLLNHTAGLPDYGALDDYRRAIARGDPVWSDDEFADHTYRRGLLFVPGRGWAYSNPGYALLVRLLERTWERSLGELLKEQIFAPLTLTRTRLADTLDQPDICPATSPALSVDGRPRPVKNHYPVGWVWHRLVVSDAADSARFLDALLRGRWLGEQLTAAMTELTPVGAAHPPWSTPSYGLGLMGEPDGRRGSVYGHNGGGPGYSASAYFVTATGTTVAVIAATEAADAVFEAALQLHDRVTSP